MTTRALILINDEAFTADELAARERDNRLHRERRRFRRATDPEYRERYNAYQREYRRRHAERLREYHREWMRARRAA
jgi:GrpB-like predicted nucleotidyltransferase (UPF0157 family)